MIAKRSSAKRHGRQSFKGDLPGASGPLMNRLFGRGGGRLGAMLIRVSSLLLKQTETEESVLVLHSVVAKLHGQMFVASTWCDIRLMRSILAT